MTAERAPYHAHIYYELHDRGVAERLHRRFMSEARAGDATGVVFVG